MTAASVRFPGSPTIRINGRDVDPGYVDSGDYTPRCRLYRTSDGLPGKLRTRPRGARTVEIAPSAVPFYRREGILPRAPRQSTDYRKYTDDDLRRLGIVVSLRWRGFELPVGWRLD